MAEPRDDVPLADLEEQQRDLDDDTAAGEVLPRGTGIEANEADVLEQSLSVDEAEDYPPGPATDE
jgi:hypothetical protein